MRSQRAVITVLAAALWVASAAPLLAADNGTVDAQVTVATPCILVSPSTLDFGTLPFTTLSNQGYAPRAIQIENCGTSQEQLFGRGTDATANAVTVWTLSDTEPCNGGLNEYFLRARDNSNTGPFVALTTVDQPLEVVGSGNLALTNELQLVMPCAGSDGVGEVVTFQAVFTATF